MDLLGRFQGRYWTANMTRVRSLLLIWLGAILAALAAAAAAAQAQTLSLGANFTTVTRNQTRTVSGFLLEPPDTMGAAGPNHFVAFNNGSVSIFTKDGAFVSRVSDASFWTTALGSSPGNLTDPRILYDSASQRWFAVMVTTSESKNNKILFARSNTSDPTQGFKGVSYTTSNNRFADFPTLGVDANGVYVGTNNFNSKSGPFSNVGIYSVPKVDLVAETPSLARLTNLGSLNASTYGFTLQPVVNYGPKLPTDPTPIVAGGSSNFSQYRFTPLSGTTNSGATLGSATTRTVLSVTNPTDSAQPGAATLIDNGDRRFAGNVVQVGNYLYGVHGTRTSGRSAVRWTIADATTFAIVQQGTISDAALSFFFPSIAVNTSGDVVVGFSGSNSTTYASAYAVVGTSAGGAPGGSLTFGTPVQTKAGVDYYAETRWGDYSAVTLDPADPGIFWSHQEFATTRSSPSTNGNWATQATEVIPTKSGERRWSNTAGGSFAAAANYFTATAPVATDHIIFSRSSTSYAVTVSGAASSNRASVRQGAVTWNLAGGSYTLTNANPATPSLTVADYQGTASLTVTGGALNTVHSTIGGAAGGGGTLTLGAGAAWTNSASTTIGGAGQGTLTVQALSTAHIGTTLAVGQSGAVHLNGGTLRFDGYSRASGGTVDFTAGTLQLAGNRTLGSDAAIQDFLGVAPQIDTGKTLVVEGGATVAGAANVTLSGGAMSAESLLMLSGSQLATTQPSLLSTGPMVAQSDSVVDAIGGNLVLGDAANIGGFYGNGALHIHANTVALADADEAVLDSLALVSLGSGGSPGTLSAANGLTLNFGGQITGHGAIDTPDELATPFLNDGSLSGTSLAEPLTLPGYVKGVGAFDNVDFTGTFSPGSSTAVLSLGSARYDGSLQIEIGGVQPGADYDQLNHALAGGVAQLGGILDVSLLNDFVPAAGDVFEIITALGGVSGAFADSILPTLAGGLLWNLNYNYGGNSVLLEVIAPGLPGDFNGDDIVDAADYVVWRHTAEPPDGYELWSSHFGDTAGGSGAAEVSAAVPEPSALLMLASAAFALAVNPRLLAIPVRPKIVIEIGRAFC